MVCEMVGLESFPILLFILSFFRRDLLYDFLRALRTSARRQSCRLDENPTAAFVEHVPPATNAVR